MTVLRSCVRCGRPSQESYCSDHKPKPWASSIRRQRVKLSGSAEQARAKRILEQYLGCCHACGGTGAEEVDHVIPLGEGGVDAEENLRPIHSECHREKTAAESRRARL